MFRRLLTRYGLLLPLLILAVIMIDRVERPQSTTAEDVIDMRQTRADYYMSDFRTRVYNDDGTLEYIVKGDTLAHYPDDNRSEITNPRVELHEDQIVWFIESDKGRFDPEPNVFTLEGRVKIKRLSGDTAPVIVSTSTLSVQLTNNIVETQDEIRIQAPAWQLQARGLRSLIDDGRLQLLSEVKGEYAWPRQ